VFIGGIEHSTNQTTKASDAGKNGKFPDAEVGSSTEQRQENEMLMRGCLLEKNRNQGNQSAQLTRGY
jgi:hypothetical protein